MGELINKGIGKDQPFSGLGLGRNTEIDNAINRGRFKLRELRIHFRTLFPFFQAFLYG